MCMCDYPVQEKREKCEKPVRDTSSLLGADTKDSLICLWINAGAHGPRQEHGEDPKFVFASSGWLMFSVSPFLNSSYS